MSETTSGGVAVCVVEATLAPSIGVRVALPTRTWAQRYMQLGCGGLCGRTSLDVGVADGCAMVSGGGFVMASTDMGHTSDDAGWGADAQKREDFAHRAVHLTAETARALIRRFYGQPERFSYFNGCSDGGREALVEAQRYPDDFDGILAGAPAMVFQVQNSLFHGWQARSNTGPDGKAILLAARLPILHRAVVAACDALDGQTDQLIAAPSLCRFDPSSVQCRAGQDPANCLTADEVAVARRFYEGPRDARTGERLTVGGPQPGSELAWAGVYVPQAAGQPTLSERIALEAMRDLIFESDPPTSLAGLTFDRATFDRLRPRHPLLDATSPDLAAFAARGGTVILWHGWADPHISPLTTIAYHQAVQARMGEERTASFERLYLLPGVYHCAGGEGPSQLDLVTPMMAWVERGLAPDAIVTRPAPSGEPSAFGQPGAGRPSGSAHRMDDPDIHMDHPDAGPAPAPSMPGAGGSSRGRPVFPYPTIAVHDGKGDVKAAASYRRGTPAAVTVPAWAGADFFR